MKFYHRYAGMLKNGEESHGIIRAEKPGKCAVCNELTEYVDINHEAYVCSDECMKKLEDGFFREAV